MLQTTVQEAAVLLNKSVENIRKMARRGRLKSKKIKDRVYILLEDSYTEKSNKLKAAGVKQHPDAETVISRLREEVDRLKKENHSLILSVQKLSTLLEKKRV